MITSFISDILSEANSFMWGWFMIIVLFFTHLFFTFRTGFIQRYVGKGIKLAFSGNNKNAHCEGDVSHFSSLMIALAATIGAGNIVGVATAISLGGPGAVFWCWITGFFGIATKYSEAVLALKYRVITPNGTCLGGPMYALEKGLNSKFLAVLFCIFTVLASFGIGNLVQANTFSDVLNRSFDVPLWVSGIVSTIFVAFVLIGGVKSIAAVCRKLVPLMAILYIISCLAILVVNSGFILPSIQLIVSSAFSSSAIGGGMLGGGIMLAARYGIARGLFSNESGMGSAPIAAAAAKTKVPAEQGLVSMTGTFWDTVVVCALTGLVIVGAQLKNPSAYLNLQGVRITYEAFSAIPFGSYLIVISLVCFTFSTLVGWSYYGERCIEYLSGGKGIIIYRVVWVILVYIGATTTLDIVWNFSDLSNALMVIPNVIALFGLHKVIKRETENISLYKPILGKKK
jgi:AGCS family alanine or glycine:cation symporter